VGFLVKIEVLVWKWLVARVKESAIGSELGLVLD
jgi:hypothetical protein